MQLEKMKMGINIIHYFTILMLFMVSLKWQVQYPASSCQLYFATLLIDIRQYIQKKIVLRTLISDIRFQHFIKHLSPKPYSEVIVCKMKKKPIHDGSVHIYNMHFKSADILCLALVGWTDRLYTHTNKKYTRKPTAASTLLIFSRS